MNRNKWISLALSAALVCLMLTGCMNAGARVVPEAENGAMPDASVAPGTDATNAIVSGAEQAFDWLTQGISVESKINMISEIQKSRVIVSGQTALVGVTFANQYQGEMTQRIRDMVAGEIQSADAAIQSVAVTAAQEDVDRINAIADKLQTGTPMSEVQGEIDSIIRNVTTIQ